MQYSYLMMYKKLLIGLFLSFSATKTLAQQFLEDRGAVGPLEEEFPQDRYGETLRKMKKVARAELNKITLSKMSSDVIHELTKELREASALLEEKEVETTARSMFNWIKPGLENFKSILPSVQALEELARHQITELFLQEILAAEDLGGALCINPLPRKDLCYVSKEYMGNFSAFKKCMVNEIINVPQALLTVEEAKLFVDGASNIRKTTAALKGWASACVQSRATDSITRQLTATEANLREFECVLLGSAADSIRRTMVLGSVNWKTSVTTEVLEAILKVATDEGFTEGEIEEISFDKEVQMMRRRKEQSRANANGLLEAARDVGLASSDSTLPKFLKR
jgi:hypothetical protein